MILVDGALLELPDIDQVPRISEDDIQCFQDLKKVLEKHGKVGRFGVLLLHQHFRIENDEILCETCDSENRTLTIKPVKTDGDIMGSHRPTQWRLDGEEAVMNCVCPENKDGHLGSHVHTN